MKKMTISGCLFLFLTSLLLGGCAVGPPVKNPQITRSNLPQKVFIEGVPLYRQTYMDCGPTSLRMVLNFYGKDFSQEEIVKVRRGRVTVASDMESFARSLGFEVYTFYDSRKDGLKFLVAQGYPLIVFGVPPPEWHSDRRYLGEGHYVVVVGYDEIKNIFIINDPGPGKRLEIPYEVFKDFHRSHPTQSNYVLCIYPKPK